jgi:hypothetical protein
MDFNDVIQSLNKDLYPREIEDYSHGVIKSSPKTIHVIGAPRSGTTLLTQLIASYSNVGYINNLIAAFYKAPVHGILLSKKLLGTDYVSTFKSNFGATASILEPHEFSYFWKHHLAYKDYTQLPESHNLNINWEHLKITLAAMEKAFDLPVLFKSFHLGFHAASVYKYLPNTCFILIKRDPIDNASSILKMRNKLKGSENEWASFLPQNHQQLEKEDKFTQALWQVNSLNKIYEDQLVNIPKANYKVIDYSDLQDENTLLDVFNSFSLQQKEGFSYPDIKIRRVSLSAEEKEIYQKAKHKVLKYL